MRQPLQILTLLTLVLCSVSCEETVDDPNSLTASDLKNSIFYVTERIDQFTNNNNITAFFIYKTTIEKKIKLPIEITGNASTFQLINSTLYYIQSNTIKSYNLLTKKIKNHVLVNSAVSSLSISNTESFLAYRHIDQIVILDLLTDRVVDILENHSAFNLHWSPIDNHLLIQSIPSLIYDVEEKVILASLQNTVPQFEAWRADGKHLFYKLTTDNSSSYVLHELASNVISEIPTGETAEIHKGNFSSSGKNFGYLHTPRNYISNFHYLNTLTNVDILINGDSVLISDFKWFSKIEDQVLFSDYYSLFVYKLSDNSVEKAIKIIDPISDQQTFITYMKILE